MSRYTILKIILLETASVSHRSSKKFKDSVVVPAKQKDYQK